MYDLILIRYGELVLKGGNRKQFTNTLKQNIIKQVGEVPIVAFDRMYLNYSEDNLRRLNYVFGISSFSPVKKVETNIEKIKEIVLQELDPNSKTFRLNCHRNWKKFEYNSEQIINIVASQILKNTNKKVDLFNYDEKINIEIRENYSYIFNKSYKGLDGLPVGISGKTLHLISGGIDSPVAAYELMKRGVHVDFLSFITPPHTDDKTIEKVNRIVQLLSNYQGGSKLFQINYTDLMNYIGFVSDQSYKINLMRRSFYRIADIIAKKGNYLAISNGENLGQVASQTMESIYVIGSQTSLPIYRPLLTFNKNDTIKIAQKIKTYEISIEKANEACEIFAPKRPVIKPTFIHAEKLENELSEIKELENQAIETKMTFSRFKNILQ
ncbi:tRNA uracil 4-sulfurtransferase ThiI [Mesomycoplasma lagogenitalium]|uniref:Probable tRNA sulfurtransferase n=1 Tax=Mesomycoplasma lagogenitalium TaxID=171286 RepID=A0ABY8LTU0_9BACT|nr:tRNA uracil 4-sulfurtransferase ThiI [Mesomycoplasma lagogenitalium]WGI36653.1 tRNA 4-thiouridine(8) synthase ThiI [Mesomycoplasma lagogenitalium]